jgi:uncharacterized protein (DUF58 family)
MISKEILEKVRRIQITTSRAVTSVFAGQYKSVFKGQGLEFEELREYQIGDELRMIDWNVTARIGKPFVKRYVEERQMTVMILLDMSRSFFFGTSNDLKKNIAAEICSVLALSAVQNSDRVGLIIFTDRIEKFFPPRKGLKHVFKIVREALYCEPKGKLTDIPAALRYLDKVVEKSAVTFIISDFYAEAMKKPLSIATKRHDIIAVTITDPREMTMPSVGAVEIYDAESGRNHLLDTTNPAVNEKYRLDALKRLEERKKLFYSVNVDSIDVSTAEPYEKSLIKFFKKRLKRKNR